jgi:hypothetical protein
MYYGNLINQYMITWENQPTNNYCICIMEGNMNKYEYNSNPLISLNLSLPKH